MQSGYQVSIVKPNYKETGYTSYTYDGIPVLEYPESPVNNRALQTGRQFPEGIAAFEKLLEEERPHILHFQELSGSNGVTIEHVRIAVKLNIRLYFTFHLISYVCSTSTLLYKNKYPCNGVIHINKCSVCNLSQKGLPDFIAEAAGRAGWLINAMGINLTGQNSSITNLLSYARYIKMHQNKLHELVALCEKVFVLNNWFRDILVKNGLPAKNITVLSRAMPGEAGNKTLVERPAAATTAVRLVYMGRICKVKGLDILLSAFTGINAPGVSLDIYGMVTEESFHQECLALANNNPRVQWKGIAPPNKVVALLQHYDLLVFPSIVQEMSPLVTMEAAMAGVPVLAPAMYANVEAISDGENGWLYPANTTRALKNKLSWLLGNVPLIMEAKKNIRPVLPFDVVVQEHLAIYNVNAGTR